MNQNQPHQELEEGLKALNDWSAGIGKHAMSKDLAFLYGFDSGQQSAQVALAHERQRYEDLRVKVMEFLDAERNPEKSWDDMMETITKLRQTVCPACNGTGKTSLGSATNLPCPFCGPMSQSEPTTPSCPSKPIEPKE